ncbi:MAG: hypothetical protein ACYC63_00410 [Armatimonadota bacterium]
MGAGQFLQLTVELYAEDDESKTTEYGDIEGSTWADDLLMTVIIPKLRTLSGGRIIDSTTEIASLFGTISDAEFVEEGEDDPPGDAQPAPSGPRPGPVKRTLLAIGHFVQAGVKYTWDTFIKGLAETLVDKLTRGP